MIAFFIELLALPNAAKAGRPVASTLIHVHDTVFKGELPRNRFSSFPNKKFLSRA